MNGDFPGLQAIGKGHLRRFPLFNGYGLRIGIFADVWTSLWEDFLDGVGAGKQVVRQNGSVRCGGITPHQLMIAVIDFKFPTSSAAAVRHSLYDLYAAGIPFVCKADCRRRTSCYRHLLRICTGTVIHLTDGAVRMSQLLDVVSPRRQTGSGNLAAAIGGMRAGYQLRTGGIRIDTEFPSGEVLSILGGFGQADTSRPWSDFQLEVGIEAACGRSVQRYRCLVAGTGHIPDSVCGVGRGGQIPGCLIYRGLGDLPGLGDIQRIPALVKLRTIPIREGKVGQDAVAVRH